MTSMVLLDDVIEVLALPYLNRQADLGVVGLKPCDVGTALVDVDLHRHRVAPDGTAKKAQCSAFTAQLDSIRASQRTSGSASQMESLNERRRGIENQQRSAGC